MKILMINSVCGIRSTGRICTDIADILKEQGHECLIAYGRETVPDKYSDIAMRIGSNLEVNANVLKARFFDNEGFHAQRATKKLIAQISEYNPDIIHLHNIHGYYINIEILFDYIKREKKPVIWTFHDCWPFTGHCAYFDHASCNKWQTGCFSCPQRGSYPKSLCDHSERNYEKKKNIFTGVENMTIVTPSKWLGNLVQQSFLKEYPIKVIPNGIDLSVFKPTDGTFRQKHHLEDKKIVLGVASAWSASKGLYDFIELSKMLDSSYQIVLVGLTEKQCASLPRSILGIIRTNDVAELAQLYTTADVFVNPSKQETMGLTTVEAMACGTPVVVSNLTAVPEVVTNDGGLILDMLSVSDIKASIENILKDRDKYKPIENAVKYEKKSQYLEYCTLYQSALEKEGSYKNE